MGVLVDDFLRANVPNVYAAGENMTSGNHRFGGERENRFWALLGFSLLDRARK